MRILTAHEIRSWDAYTIAHEPIASIDLMERAAQAALENIPSHFFSGDTNALFLCGSGNNGGDGLAMARLLSEVISSNRIHVFLTETNNYSSDNQGYQERLKDAGIQVKNLTEFLNASIDNTIIIDCLLGTGFSGPLREGIIKDAINHVNNSKARVISIDLPSGLDTDQPGQSTTAIKAAITLTFQALKIPFLIPQCSEQIGNWKVVPIGLHPHKSFDSKRFFLTNKDLPKLKKRDPHSHKGNHGHALFVAGAAEMIGASILSCQSALHTGLGLLSVWQPGSDYSTIQTALPEAMALFNKKVAFEKYSAIAIGPGLGTTSQALDKLNSTLSSGLPLVLDADALNLISSNNLLHEIPEGSILTPHPKEFERLSGSPTTDRILQLQAAEKLASEHKLNILIKGAYSIIALSNGETWFNSTGNASMAKGGMGDALTGLILGLLAQGYSSHDSLNLAAFIHGSAGDTLQKRQREFYTTSELVTQLSNEFLILA